jgi:hypothetical protein
MFADGVANNPFHLFHATPDSFTYPDGVVIVTTVDEVCDTMGYSPCGV